MRFSIIIPNLNSTIINLTLAALENQCQQGQDEILVIGLDEPGLVQESSLIRFISTDKPVSPATARNIGLRKARGDVICFIDADCIPQPNWLHLISQRFNDPAIAILGGGVDTSQSDFWALCVHLSSFHDYLIYNPPGSRDQLPTLNLAIRKSALNEVGYFNERFFRSEDADLTTRLRIHGYKLYFDPQIAIDHQPNRHTLHDALIHAIQSGYYSIKVDHFWQDKLQPSVFLRYRWLFIFTAPLMALAVTIKIYCNRRVWHWWYLAPAIFVLKLAWCWGAAKRLHKRKS